MFDKTVEVIDGKEAITVKGLGYLSLKDTLECGQCFRYERIEPTEYLSEYIYTASGTLLHVAQREYGELIFFGLSDEDFERVALPLFSLESDLEDIKNDVIKHTDSEWLKSAAEYSRGIAILKQEPFETLISFIISQNNNIPRIRKIIKAVAAEYGVNLCLQSSKEPKCPLGLCSGIPCEENCKKCGVCYSFPTAEDILKEPEKLLPSKPGFRYKYILDACEKVVTGELNLDMIAAARSYTYTTDRLKSVKGVGDKVASCVALFGFGNLEAFPIDVWMKRAIEIYFNGELDPSSLGRYAGVAQQYIFHYIRHLEGIG